MEKIEKIITSQKWCMLYFPKYDGKGGALKRTIAIMNQIT